MKIAITALLFMCLLLSACGKRKFSVPTSSMEPTIPKGSMVIADMNAFSSDAPARFDLVVFNPPEDVPPNSKEKNTDVIYCMRIIGLPGEKIEIINDEVFIDSKQLETPSGLAYLTQGPKTKMELPSDGYFIVGDNSANSYDSRYWGTLPRINILGKVTEIQPVR